MKEKKSLKERMLITFLILLGVHILSQIPIWGINRGVIDTWLSDGMMSALGVFNLFSGLSFESLSIFALGIAPYISASIILQLLRVAIPALDKTCKDAKSEKDFVEKLTVFGAFGLGIIQTIPIVINLANSGLLMENTTFYKLIVGGTIFVGSLILIGLGKVIDKKGIGKGISLILLINILSSLKGDLTNVYQTFIAGKAVGSAALAVGITLVVILVSLLIVIYLQEGKKDIKVTYPTNNKGNRMSHSVQSVIPLKVNMSGVMPVIFASTVVQIFPMVVAFMKLPEDSVVLEISKYFNQMFWFDFSNIKYTLGVLLYFVCIIFFSYFYNMISFNVRDVAENLSRQGATIMGIRAGKSTQEYLMSQMRYLILVGAILLIIVTVIPIIIGGLIGINLAMGGTSIIIIVSVLIETYRTYISEKTVESPYSAGKGLL